MEESWGSRCVAVWHSVNSQWIIHFLVLVNWCWWPKERKVCLAAWIPGDVAECNFLSVFLALLWLCKIPLSLFLQVCVSSIASSLSLTLSLSLLCSICASVTRQRGDPWANSHLRCSAASLLTRLSWGSGVCRLLCSLWPTQSMAGQAASRTGPSEWWARPPRCVSGASVRGGLYGLEVFVLCRRRSRWVKGGSTPGNKGHGGRSLRWKEGGARWRFRERFIFTMATSLTVNHMQPQCAVHIRPSFALH